MAQRALHDPLTGLPNRQLCLDRLGLSLLKLERQPGAVAVCYVDLDHFKRINDTLGHEAGDRALIEVARRLRASTRGVDTVARLAGDEFVAVCPDIGDVDGLLSLAERIHSALGQPFAVHDRPVDLGASIGMSLTRSSSTSPAQLLREADAAMYQVKRRGRRGYALYEESLVPPRADRVATTRHLREALDADGLRLHYQPVVDLLTGRIVGAEALLRLVHPRHGMLSPHAFIEVAEESELIVAMGGWVLQQACQQAAHWNRCYGPLQMSVNISSRQASQRVLTEQVQGALQDSALDPSRLCLELTERVLMDCGGILAEDMRALERIGVHLALDDFGTGFSSLTYLKRFPVHTLKTAPRLWMSATSGSG